MVFPFVIFAQYFSRGVLFVSCLAQEQWMILVGGLAVSSVIGPLLYRDGCLIGMRGCL